MKEEINSSTSTLIIMLMIVLKSLQNFKINFSAKTYNEKQQLLEVEGESLSTQEILTFLENLQKSLILENPELTYMERLKQESLYIFKIASTLNAPKNA